MLDLSGFPHVLQEIMSFSDRPTLCALARTSSSTQRVVTPFLYPNTLFDPLYSSGAIPPSPLAPRTIDTCNTEPLSAARVEERLVSLLSSPNLACARTIIIDHPQEWARDLERLREKPTPAVRGEGTVTIVRVEPLVREVMMGGAGPAELSPARQAEWGRHLRRKAMAYYYQGLAAAPSSAIQPHPQPYDRATTIESRYNAPPGDAYFAHLFDIAALLPSDHLVLHVPAAQGIDLGGLVCAACNTCGPPSTSTRKLTIVAESRNGVDSATAFHRMGWRTQHPWDLIELVLVPDISGTFSYTYHTLSAPSDIFGSYKSSPPPVDVMRTSSRFLYSPLAESEQAAKWPQAYTMVGVEGLEVAKEELTKLKDDLLEKGSYARNEKGVVVKFVELEEWGRENSVLVGCKSLKARD